MSTDNLSSLSANCHGPWNKGRFIGQKRPLKPKDVWAIRVRLQIGGCKRDLSLFDLAIDSKLRACDLVRLRVDQVQIDGRVRERTTIVQKKTGRPVQFELTEPTRVAVREWLTIIEGRDCLYLFPSRLRARPHLSNRQYARLVGIWVKMAGLESAQIQRLFRRGFSGSGGGVRTRGGIVSHTAFSPAVARTARPKNGRPDGPRVQADVGMYAAHAARGRRTQRASTINPPMPQRLLQGIDSTETPRETTQPAPQSKPCTANTS